MRQDRPGQGWVLAPRAQPGHDRASALPTAADSNGDSNSSSQRQASAVGSTPGHSHVAGRLGICPACEQTVEARSPYGNLAPDEDAAGSNPAIPTTKPQV